MTTNCELKEFRIDIKFVDPNVSIPREETIVRRGKSAESVREQLVLWFKKNYKMLPGDNGLRINVVPNLIVKKEVFETEPADTSNPVAEGIAIKRRKELNVFAEHVDEDGNKETITVQDIFGHRPQKTSKPLAPSAAGPSFKNDLKSGYQLRRRYNGELPEKKPSLVQQMNEVLIGLIDDDFAFLNDSEVYHLVELNKNCTRIVKTTDCGLENLKMNGELLYEVNEKQYAIIHNGKFIWATPAW